MRVIKKIQNKKFLLYDCLFSKLGTADIGFSDSCLVAVAAVVAESCTTNVPLSISNGFFELTKTGTSGVGSAAIVGVAGATGCAGSVEVPVLKTEPFGVVVGVPCGVIC